MGGRAETFAGLAGMGDMIATCTSPQSRNRHVGVELGKGRSMQEIVDEMVAVVVNDCPGFLVNRVLFPYFDGFSKLVRDGADFQAIDKVMERWGWPMGPAYLTDVIGMDTGVHAGQVMAEGFPDRMMLDFQTPTELMFEKERYGQKNGKGFYEYIPDKRGKPKKTASEEAYKVIAPITEVLPGHPVGVLTGPNLAREIMAGQAAASVIAMEDDIIVRELQSIFKSGLFRVYTNNDCRL